MTKYQLDAIRKRCAAASPGPWDWTYDGSSDYSIGHKDDSQDRAWGVVWNQDHEEVKPNLEFCAHARTDIRTLLSEIERLEAEAEARDRRVRAEAEKLGKQLAAEFNAYRRYYEYTPKANGITEAEQEDLRRTFYQSACRIAEQILPRIASSALRGAGEAGA